MAVRQKRSPSSNPDAADLLRRVVKWSADVSAANPHVVPHDDACGERFFCGRCRGRFGGYRTAEILTLSGDLLLHCEGLRLRPSDTLFPERRAELSS